MNRNHPAIVPWPQHLTMTSGTFSGKSAPKETISSDLAPEAYTLHITPEGICAEAGSKIGLQYAGYTLRQLLLQYQDDIPCMEISDAPAREYRSFHMDSARHFIPVDELKKMIAICAFFKLNKFHWHFSDDQGWRIESDAFPLLHQVGGRRKGDHFGNYASDQEEYFYYTKEQVKDIVSYCASLGIEVVPEIDIPGHVTAILAAYPQYSCSEHPVEVATSAGIFREIFCPGKEETFTFIERLLDELCDLFPGVYFHIGGDEAPKNNWKSCPFCQKRMKEEGLSNVQQLQGYFNNRVARYLKGKGKTVIVWNEATLGGNLDTDIIMQAWNDGKAPGSNQVTTLAKEHLLKGGRVIMSPFSNSYCDYPYAFHSLKKVYELSFVPYGMDELTEEQNKRVLGSESLLWSEFIRDASTRERLAWPRFASGAEIGWYGKCPGDYKDFARRLKTIFSIFSRFHINAEAPEGWVPGPVETVKQLAEFKKRFSKEAIAEVRKNQKEI